MYLTKYPTDERKQYLPAGIHDANTVQTYPESWWPLMEPGNHILLALFPVVGYSLLRHRRPTTGPILLLVIGASLFPDLVDKPLAWTLGVVPSGRMVAHSLVIAVPIVALVYLLAVWTGRRSYGVAFLWGYLIHITGDFYPILWHGTDYYFFPNLFWPLLKANPDPNPGFGDKIPVLSVEILPKLTVLALIFAYIIVDIGRRIETRSHGQL